MRLTRMPRLRSGRLRSHFLFTCCRLALLCQALGIALNSCGQVGSCEAYPPPSVTSRLFVTGGRLYLSSQGSGLLVVQTNSGQQVWQTSGILEAIGASQIYLGTSFTSASLLLEALRASDGKPLWHATESENTKVLGELDQALYLYDQSTATLVALSALTGSVRWQTPVIRPPTSDETSTVAVQVSASVVYLLSPSGQLSAYQEASGKLLWSVAAVSHLPHTPTPWQVSGGVIYLADGEHLAAVQASSGKPLWQRLASTFVLDRATGTLLALGPPTSHASLAALDPSSGQVLWQRAEPAAQPILIEEGVGLILSDGIVYLGNWQFNNLPLGMAPISFRGQVTALSASDGHYLWRYQGEGNISLSVAGTATTIYLLSYWPIANQTESRLIALQASSGKLLWQHGADPAAGMLLADQVLYTGYGGDGQTSGCLASGAAQLAAYRGSDGQQIWHIQTSNLSG